MRVILYAGVAIAALSGVQAAIPKPGDLFQIQPTTKDSRVARKPCITVFNATDGAPVTLNDCSAGTQQRGWQVTANPGEFGQIKIFSTFCLAAGSGGGDTFITTCVDNDVRQTWRWGPNDGQIQFGGFLKLCLDLKDPNQGSGNKVQANLCASVDGSGATHQEQWDANPLADPFTQLVHTPTGFCIGVGNTTNGSPVFVVPCGDNDVSKVWMAPQPGHGNSGLYRLATSQDGAGPVKCLDVTDGINKPGTKLQVWDCNGGPNQRWLPSTSTVTWDGISRQFPMCIDLTDGITTRGNQIQIWNCTGGPNQRWVNSPPSPNVK